MDIRTQCLCTGSARPSKTAGFREAALGWRRTCDTEAEAVLDQAAEVARLEAPGARRAGIGQGGVSWVVPAHPGGNEFCLLKAPAA